MTADDQRLGRDDRPTDAEVEERVAENRWFSLMLLLSGPDRTQDEATADRIQQEHLRHLFALERAGKLTLFGPVEGAGDLRGIGILTVDSPEEAEAIVAHDPAVVAGRLRIEVHPWFARPGSCLPERP